MIYNFLSVYGIYYPSGTIETRAKWRILSCKDRYTLASELGPQP